MRCLVQGSRFDVYPMCIIAIIHLQNLISPNQADPALDSQESNLHSKGKAKFSEALAITLPPHPPAREQPYFKLIAL